MSTYKNLSAGNPQQGQYPPQPNHQRPTPRSTFDLPQQLLDPPLDDLPDSSSDDAGSCSSIDKDSTGDLMRLLVCNKHRLSNRCPHRLRLTRNKISYRFADSALNTEIPPNGPDGPDGSEERSLSPNEWRDNSQSFNTDGPNGGEERSLSPNEWRDNPQSFNKYLRQMRDDERIGRPHSRFSLILMDAERLH